MPKKNMSAEERKAWGAKMKAARQAARENKKNQVTEDTKAEVMETNDLDVLKQQIKELQDRLNLPQLPQGVTSTKQVITKFSFDPAAYPDPTERLANEPKLARIAFPLNYDLKWDVQRVDYEEDGMKVRAPRFLLELHGKVIDEETNEVKKKYDPATKEWKEERFIVKRGMFFEDPDFFIDTANHLGIAVPEFVQKEFMDEMRYTIMRDWLLENFFPPKLSESKSRKEVVIGNQLVEVFELTTDADAATPKMPFDSLSGKV